MARGKVRNRDIVDNMIDSNKIINGSIMVEDLKLLDTGDSTGINAETLPYDHTAASPTIWDKIQAIVLATDIQFDTFTSTSGVTSYQITGSRQIDTSRFLLVIYNGQFIYQGASLDYQVTTTTLTDDTITFNWNPETGYQIYVVFEALP